MVSLGRMILYCSFISTYLLVAMARPIPPTIWGGQAAIWRDEPDGPVTPSPIPKVGIAECFQMLVGYELKIVWPKLVL